MPDVAPLASRRLLVLPVQTTVLAPVSDPKNQPGLTPPRYRVSIT